MIEHYPSDLTDKQWQLIRSLLPKPAKRGRPPIDGRDILDAVLYVVRTGCQWRQLPLDFPKWKTVYTVFWRWRKAGIWGEIHDALRRRRSLTVSPFGPPKVAKNGAMTQAKRSPGASDTWPSILWDLSGQSSCMERTGKITRELTLC